MYTNIKKNSCLHVCKILDISFYVFALSIITTVFIYAFIFLKDQLQLHVDASAHLFQFAIDRGALFVEQHLDAIARKLGVGRPNERVKIRGQHLGPRQLVYTL